MQISNRSSSARVSALVRPLRESDLNEAKRIFHLAFGTFLGLPDPMQFFPDRNYVRGRYFTNPEGALGAEVGGKLIGANFVTNWGSVSFFGPLCVHPEFWELGIAQQLLRATIEIMEKQQTRHAGLTTFPHSTKHVHLYQKFGFWPRFLTTVMSKSVHPAKQAVSSTQFSDLSAGQQTECLTASRELTDELYRGLDLRHEIQMVASQKLGDTIFVWENSRLVAFAVCHVGSGTEAGNDVCYVKFGAARTTRSFELLIEACEAFAIRNGLSRMEAGVNMGRQDAYQRMQAHGFRPEGQGVIMHKPNEPGYCRPDAYVMDDWR